MAIEPFAHVTRRQPSPDDVRKPRRDMIERLRPDEWLVRGGQHRQARTEARPENADALEALLRQPGYRTTRVHHGLPADLDRSHDIRAHDVVRPRELFR